MRSTVWWLWGGLALLGCGSITPLRATASDGAAPATALPDTGAALTPPPDSAAVPEAGPAPTPAKGGDKGDDGMGSGDDAPGGSKKGPRDASSPKPK